MTRIGEPAFCVKEHAHGVASPGAACRLTATSRPSLARTLGDGEDHRFLQTEHIADPAVAAQGIHERELGRAGFPTIKSIPS